MLNIGLNVCRDAFRGRKEATASLKLANELVELGNYSGGAYRKREELHKRAEQNRNFAHFLK